LESEPLQLVLGIPFTLAAAAAVVRLDPPPIAAVGLPLTVVHDPALPFRTFDLCVASTTSGRVPIKWPL
jgi:hypothetical protein